MAPFRRDDKALPQQLPYRLMQNGPVTKYWRRGYFEEELAELLRLGYSVTRFDCASWAAGVNVAADLKARLGMPDYTGGSFDAIRDSLSDIDVPEMTGRVVALDNFTGRREDEVLLDVLADASREWLLFGRIFMVLVRTDDQLYRGPAVGCTTCMWNDREWLDSERS